MAFDTTFATALALNSLTITSYAGTVSVQDGTSAGTLMQTSGQINQLGSSSTGYDFYVTQGLNLTGGTFNGTANTGILHLQGVTTGLIGSVTTGSTLNVEAGTTLQYSNTTISFANEATLHMFAGSYVRPQFLDGSQLGQFINANPQGGDQAPMVVEGGTFVAKLSRTQGITVKDTGRVEFKSSIEIKGNAGASSKSLLMEGGEISVDNGVTLTVQKGFEISGGTFSTVSGQLPLGFATEETVYIAGDMKVTGGTLTLGSADGLRQFGALQVIGNVVFEGGEFKTKVNGTPTNVERDLWTCTGKFTIKAAAKVSPTVLHEPSGGVAGRFWEVIIADDKFTDATKPTMSTAWDCAITGTDKKLQVFKA